MASLPAKIADGVYRVDAIRFPNAVSVLLLENEDGWTLVDTGVEGGAARIRDAFAALGSGPEDLKRIFLTHHHVDHVGGLEELTQWAPHAELGATEYEAMVISGMLPPAPPSNAVLRLTMPGLADAPKFPVRKILREGDVVSGFRIIPTPGHSLGHASLLRDSDGLLFTADAFGCLPRKVRVGVRKGLCVDPTMARRSAQKLVGERFDTVILAHGPVLRSGARKELQKAVERCRY
ncbi:MAG TPA: MBL fold metallo-hydrolase [Rubrobacter sp.]|jgi:glyoxylase-like metal-dependent hydrolase (beta-lactamase superfamily II)|nr:MBL fold metallo-hydrolase [Rubrobacter sp.]